MAEVRGLDPRIDPQPSLAVPDVPSNGLVRQAPAIDPVVELPSGVRCVRRATPADAEAIAAIQEHYELRKIDVSDHPQNGWLVQKSTPDAIRFAMQRYKDYWVAESDQGKVIAFQAVCPARFISRPAGKHKLFGPYAKRALRVLESGRFVYMSQIATDPGFRGSGLAKALQARVLARYRRQPLVAHVAVFTQQDFDARSAEGSTFEPRFNNVASHKYHQKNGYRLVGYTSDLAGTDAYNTGLPPPSGEDALPGIAGALYIDFRDGDGPSEYVDPVAAVLDAPCAPGDVDDEEWRNPFPDHWPDLDDLDSFPEGSPQQDAKLRTELLRMYEGGVEF
jgi:GNAT superfamily N-acetyltransferase